VRHPSESQPRQIAHGKKIGIGEEGRGLLRSRRIGHFAEKVLAFAQIVRARLR